MPINNTLYGIHDEAAVHSGISGLGWILCTEEVGDGNGRNFTYIAERGINVLCRLNYGYGSKGTLPPPSGYDDFARRVARYIASSRGCYRWILGNEPNHEQEWPNGEVITPTMYVSCFKKVATYLAKMADSHQLITAAVAPWNVQAGDWVAYFGRVLLGLQDTPVGGIALHTYTHGKNPSLITSQAKMESPYDDRYYHFWAYRDLLATMPDRMRRLPVYITETNQTDPWTDANSGWVKNAYADINDWNRRGVQSIHCLCLYRWEQFDQWSIQNKPGVLADLRDAIGAGYTAPAAQTNKTYIPVVTRPDGDPVPPPPSVDWDERLTQRGALLEPYVGNGDYYALVKGEWYDEHESGGKHHIYVDVVDEGGQRIVGETVIVKWSTGSHNTLTEAKQGEKYSANYPMYNVAPAYSVQVGVQSDIVSGLGLGSIEAPYNAIHTAYGFVFRRVTRESAPAPTPGPVAPMPSPEPRPSTPPIGVFSTWLIGALSRMTYIEQRFMQAVINIESRGRPTTDIGITIRFENHIFVERAGSDVSERFIFDRKNRTLGHRWRAAATDDWRDTHTGWQTGEYAAFNLARQLDERAAYESISMGIGQVMGFNHASIGYASAKEMYDAFSAAAFGTENQIAGMFAYIIHRPDALAAAQAKNYTKFGLAYNGSMHYGELLRKEYDKLGNGA